MLGAGLSAVNGGCFMIPAERIQYAHFVNSNARARVEVLPFRKEFSGTLTSPFRCSTATSNGIVVDPAPQKTDPQKPLVDYLVRSLGFSEEQALSALSDYKVTHYPRFMSSNPDLVVNLLRDYGLSYTQIKEVVSSCPLILTYKAKQTLEPRLRVLRNLGLTGSDLVQFIKEKFSFFRHNVNTVDYLRRLLGDDEMAIRAIKNTVWWPLSANGLKNMQANLLLLQKNGVSIDQINAMIAKNLYYFIAKGFEEKFRLVVEEWEIPCDSPAFIYGLRLAGSAHKSKIDERMQVFRSFGWSDAEIYMLLRKQPTCFTRSTAHIRKSLKFFMMECNIPPLCLLNNPVLLMYSLEKRVKPRYKMFKLLNEKKLINGKPSLLTVLGYSEKRFLPFVQRFEAEVPGFCQTYIDSVKTASKKP